MDTETKPVLVLRNEAREARRARAEARIHENEADVIERLERQIESDRQLAQAEKIGRRVR